MDLRGSGALVTGGASGFGEAVARTVVAAGGRVAILDLPSSRGPELVAELGVAACFLEVDVRTEGEVEAAVASAVAHCGRLDLCVNCAGVNPGGRLLGADGEPRPLDRLRAAIAVNLVGLLDVIRRAAAAMARNEPGADGERGLIVNVSSVAAYEGLSGQSAYAVTKGGVAALTLQLARELGPLGIRVNAIAPGPCATPMIAALGAAEQARLEAFQVFPRRLGQAAEFADLVAFMAATRVLNGEVVRLDSAARLGPVPGPGSGSGA